MFDAAADRYDFLNAVLSLGQDRAWRRALCRPLTRGLSVLDACCGSGRSAVAAYQRTGVPVVGVDVSERMLARGRHHARATRARVLPVRADALRLPFADETFDAVTLAWGLRNLSPEEEALAELRRVLRPGGWLHVLDASAPERGLAASIHRGYLRHVVPLLGRLSADPKAYVYLAESILAFGRAQEVGRRISGAGFECLPPQRLLLGAATVWRARKSLAPAEARLQFASSTGETVQVASPGSGTTS